MRNTVFWETALIGTWGSFSLLLKPLLVTCNRPFGKIKGFFEKITAGFGKMSAQFGNMVLGFGNMTRCRVQKKSFPFIKMNYAASNKKRDSGYCSKPCLALSSWPFGKMKGFFENITAGFGKLSAPFGNMELSFGNMTRCKGQKKSFLFVIVNFAALSME
ncbi:hypothetical protein LRR81_20810 [Metabacillus sp. GX 13764]|uniref:hypothetical protein n=1 Tax=Metabacillus kandeliae TaxID=2900151 RepID=UPI001E3337B9|nr:hypothetical protein [Metabacillus kandeliae]MCD7036695.1 hypothetical protein [Metabacillus kandeliae]